MVLTTGSGTAVLLVLWPAHGAACPTTALDGQRAARRTVVAW